MKYYTKPITANLLVTRNCNGNCTFCGISLNNDKKYIFESLCQLKSIVNCLEEQEVLRINFFGGEPMIYPAIMELISYSKQHKFYNSIVTNGLHIPYNFSEYEHCLDAMAISLHGLKETHCKLSGSSIDEYSMVMRHLGFYLSKGIPITINCTVTPLNYSEIDDFVTRICNEYSVVGFSFNRFIPTANTDVETKRRFVLTPEQINVSLHRIDNVAKRFPSVMFKYAIHFPYCLVNDKRLLKYVGSCGFGENYVSIDCKGDIQACSYSNVILGNIFQDKLNEIWNHHPSLMEYRSLRWLPKECKECYYLKRCMVGCKVTGTQVFSPDISYLERAAKHGLEDGSR